MSEEVNPPQEVEEVVTPVEPKAKKKKAEVNPFNQAKYDKLVEGAKKALAQYRIGHRELTYPGFKELSEGLGETLE